MTTRIAACSCCPSQRLHQSLSCLVIWMFSFFPEAWMRSWCLRWGLFLSSDLLFLGQWLFSITFLISFVTVCCSALSQVLLDWVFVFCLSQHSVI